MTWEELIEASKKAQAEIKKWPEWKRSVIAAAFGSKKK
jgi:hypothetical protein